MDEMRKIGREEEGDVVQSDRELAVRDRCLSNLIGRTVLWNVGVVSSFPVLQHRARYNTQAPFSQPICEHGALKSVIFLF